MMFKYITLGMHNVYKYMYVYVCTHTILYIHSYIHMYTHDLIKRK